MSSLPGALVPLHLQLETRNFRKEQDLRKPLCNMYRTMRRHLIQKNNAKYFSVKKFRRLSFVTLPSVFILSFSALYFIFHLIKTVNLGSLFEFIW